jgi:RecA-family ATPase
LTWPGVTSTGLLPALIARIKVVNPVLVIVDPMARFHGGDENSNAVGTAMVNAIERIASETGAAVLLSHHFNKGAIDDKDQSVTAVRGASAIVDASRSVLTRPLVGASGIEPPTTTMSRWCSTTELRA